MPSLTFCHAPVVKWDTLRDRYHTSEEGMPCIAPRGHLLDPTRAIRACDEVGEDDARGVIGIQLQIESWMLVALNLAAASQDVNN